MESNRLSQGGRSTVEPRHSRRVLVLDDNPELCRAVADALQAAGYIVETALHPDDAVEKLRRFAPDVLVTDVRMPDRDGFAMLDLAVRNDPQMSVVMMTGYATVPDAVRALQNGAEHYLGKPFTSPELLAVVERALARRRARTAVTAVDASRGVDTELAEGSDAMRELLARVDAAAATGSTVLITGETGAGKARVAERLHRASSRAAGPFVTVHCSGPAEPLIDAELFGRERNGTSHPAGAVERAQGGTLFLDGVDELSPALQSKILRLMQTQRYEYVGATESHAADVRIVASTNRKLETVVERGEFRADLYYRLNAVTLEVPPLRSRKSDIPGLVEQTLARLSPGPEGNAASVTPAAMELLQRYEWPGNVRELENVVEGAVIAARGAPIAPEHVLPLLRGRRAPEVGAVAIPGASFAEIERHAILSTYEACGHNAVRTAQILGIAERTVHYRLKEYSGLEGRRRVRFVRERTG